jgi:hypothetical protein
MTIDDNLLHPVRGLGCQRRKVDTDSMKTARMKTLRRKPNYRVPWPWLAALGLASLALFCSNAGEGVGASVDQKNAPAWGKFVSFHDGTLTLQGNTATMLWRNLSPDIGVSQWSEPAHQYEPFGHTAVLTKVPPGTWVFVAENRSHIQVGAGKESHVSGTFLSFEGQRLLISGSNLGNYASENGSSLHFPKFVEGIPVYTNVPGKALKKIGPAEEILPRLTKGQRITIYGEGDFNFTKIVLGPPPKE